MIKWFSGGNYKNVKRPALVLYTIDNLDPASYLKGEY